MSTKTKIALAAVLVAVASSAAPAMESSNRAAAVSRGTPHSAPVRVLQHRNVTLPTRGQADPFEIDRNDRASSPFAGGVG